MPGDDVNLAFRAAVVGLPDTVALLFQELRRQFLTQDARFSTLHISRTRGRHIKTGKMDKAAKNLRLLLWQ